MTQAFVFIIDAKLEDNEMKFRRAKPILDQDTYPANLPFS